MVKRTIIPNTDIAFMIVKGLERIGKVKKYIVYGDYIIVEYEKITKEDIEEAIIRTGAIPQLAPASIMTGIPLEEYVKTIAENLVWWFP